MYMGESASTDRNRQNLCDWILGFSGQVSQGKKSRCGKPLKPAQSKSLTKSFPI
jgi:hypothetical protein